MEDTVTMSEAARRLGVSRTKVWSMVRAGELPVRQDPLDRRQRLIPVRAIEELRAGRNYARLMPRSIGMVSDGTIQSEEVEEYLERHWKPDW